MKNQRKALIIHTSDDANELSQLKYLNDDALMLRKIIHKAIVKKQGRLVQEVRNKALLTGP